MILRTRVIVFVLVAAALSIFRPMPVDAGSSIDKVAAANQAFYQAFSNRDSNEMSQVWHHGPGSRMIGPRSAAVTEGWPAVSHGWQKVFDGFQEITISMPQPSIRAGERVAWVVGLESVKGVRTNGEPFEAAVLATNVFEKTDGTWKMVHHHASLPQRD